MTLDKNHQVKRIDGIEPLLGIQPGNNPVPQQKALLEGLQNLDRRWLALVDRPAAGWRIVRTRPAPRTYGKALPAFIHNGSYFL